MKVQKAQLEFIQTWGALGSSWGIPKSMAQIHALLLSQSKELSAEEIMEAVQLSRGNVNTNLRELSNWKLVAKVNKLGERREFFKADHDIWSIARNIVSERKKRELEPVKRFLLQMQSEKLEGTKVEVAHFQKMMTDLLEFVEQMDKISELMVKMNDNIFFKKMMKILS